MSTRVKVGLDRKQHNLMNGDSPGGGPTSGTGTGAQKSLRGVLAARNSSILALRRKQQADESQRPAKTARTQPVADDDFFRMSTHSKSPESTYVHCFGAAFLAIPFEYESNHSLDSQAVKSESTDTQRDSQDQISDSTVKTETRVTSEKSATSESAESLRAIDSTGFEGSDVIVLDEDASDVVEVLDSSDVETAPTGATRSTVGHSALSNQLGADNDDNDDDDDDDDLDPEIKRRLQQRIAERKARASTGPFGVLLKIRHSVWPELLEHEMASSERLETGLEMATNALRQTGVVVDSDKMMLVLGSRRLFGWQTAESLGLPVTDYENNRAILEVDMVTEDEWNVMEQKRREMQAVQSISDEEDDENEIERAARELAEKRAAAGAGSVSRMSSADQNDEDEDDGYFVIQLRDATRSLKVKVNAETQISKLADHFRSKFEIDPARAIRLEFDDEPLAPDSVVGDTELEQDYTVDVMIS